jgi:large subunit ribosomal protein L19
MANVIDKIKAENLKKENVPAVAIGDSVRVSIKIKEGDKERVQVYAGTVIARDGAGATETFTVRRITFGVGVEKVFPLHSPYITKVEVERHAKVRRAKLYFLRDLSGKKARLREA